MPQFDEATWRLKVDGLVANPYILDYRELRSLASTEEVGTFHCVTGWSVENVHWRGVRMSELIGRASPRPSASTLAFVSAEAPYFDTLTLSQAMLDDTILAYEMNGAPLPREHRAPIRLVIPEMYGYKNVKWVNRIAFTNQPIAGYWEQRGYDIDAWVGHSNG